ncbi:MAG: phosphotransferase [Pseudomonadota bacterium]
MTDRAARIDAFLAAAGWADAVRHPLAGDASLRRYLRLRDGPRGAILMDAPPETGEDVRPFLTMAAHLAGAGLSAPRIMAQDETAGLLLMEDLGDALLARVAADDPAREADLYAEAARTLAAMQATPAPDLVPYPPDMPDLAATVLDWYAPERRGDRSDLVAALTEAIAAMPPGPDVLLHRDFHAENLLWLPDRNGPARIGILDFQDARTGPAEYDLASLIDDPRRTVTPAARAAAIAAWRTATGAEEDATVHRTAICSVQRALRILGRTASRLCLRQDRDGYVHLIPPAWAVLQDRLDHPALADLRALLANLPEPTPARLAALRAASGLFAGRDHAEPYA